MKKSILLLLILNLLIISTFMSSCTFENLSGEAKAVLKNKDTLLIDNKDSARQLTVKPIDKSQLPFLPNGMPAKIGQIQQKLDKTELDYNEISSSKGVLEEMSKTLYFNDSYLIDYVGWIMIGINGRPLNPSVEDFLSGYGDCIAEIYTYSSESKLYYVPTSFERGKAYWVFMNLPYSECVHGVPSLAIHSIPSETYDVEIYEGWNMIAYPFPKSASTVRGFSNFTKYEIPIEDFYGDYFEYRPLVEGYYFPYSFSEVLSSEKWYMYETKGYWVFSDENQVVTFTNGD